MCQRAGFEAVVSVEANEAAVKGEFDEAIRLFTVAIKLDPTEVR